MDVRCEKCQTEYELDESRLKPGGVTVKCTNCGHMFKIRKRTPTNVGLPTVDARPRASSSQQPMLSQNEAPTVRANVRADSVLGDGTPAGIADVGSGPTERNWLVRLENGEQKTCRELATLQQWIVAGVATRESLISRSGKTWKRLGDISELAQYFDIADEARNQRAARPTPRPLRRASTRPAARCCPTTRRRRRARRPARPTPPPPPPTEGARSARRDRARADDRAGRSRFDAAAGARRASNRGVGELRDQAQRISRRDAAGPAPRQFLVGGVEERADVRRARSHGSRRRIVVRHRSSPAR